ncbi:DgyrCDS463 [Dimorphilus gyrociliatus]|uniref:Beta-1,4-mannosyltransferase n=1 Tax=Dimorphilus gyrociliatus TaxID=2664684 RepID=A0A7I8V677_9ANNE|nr:DgyrCDS463 [Dimorphilus gyrociliatus]
MSKRHPLVRFSKKYEEILGRYSDGNICVTKAMQTFLNDKWGIKSTVLYDKPFDNFGKANLEDWHKVFLKYTDLSEGKDESKFTKINEEGIVELKSDRPVLIVSSTSWTPDEDFSLLFDAMKEYDKDCNLPKAFCVVTGKGPEKEKYKKLIKEFPFKNVQWSFPWLEPEDYPILIGSADLGICLHMSSSNLDLPMKVLDMFGCEVPVLAVKYDCIGELVHENTNGLLFDTDQELAKQIKMILEGFPSKCNKLNKFRENLKNYPKWQSNWNSNALPIFSNDQ